MEPGQVKVEGTCLLQKGIGLLQKHNELAEEERPEERRATSLLKQLRACGRRQSASSRAPSGSHVSYGTSAHAERTARQLDSAAFAAVSSARPRDSCFLGRPGQA